MPRPRGLPKTGGRKPGSKNKGRIVVPEVLPPGTAESMLAETARALELASAPVRTPKAVMLDAMVHFEGLGKSFLAKADKLMPKSVDKAMEAAQEGHRFIVAAVECATKVAPYIHARLLAVESRGDMTQDKAPYVIRAPTVMADSTTWQAAVGAARGEAVASTAPSGAPPAALPNPVPLVTDQKTGRISTIMPARPVVVKPTATQEWLESVASQRKG